MSFPQEQQERKSTQPSSPAGQVPSPLPSARASRPRAPALLLPPSPARREWELPEAGTSAAPPQKRRNEWWASDRWTHCLRTDIVVSHYYPRPAPPRPIVQPRPAPPHAAPAPGGQGRPSLPCYTSAPKQGPRGVPGDQGWGIRLAHYRSRCRDATRTCYNAVLR